MYDVTLVALANLAHDARTLNLARALHKEKLSVQVVCAKATDLSEPFDVVSANISGRGALSRATKLARFVKQKRFRSRVVFGMDLFALHAAATIARRSKGAVVYDMREFYFALGPLSKSPLKQHIISRYERWLLRHVQHVLVSGPLDATIAQQHFGLSATPTVLLNTPPYRKAQPSNLLRNDYQISPDETVVVYQGVVHHGRGLAPFMAAMRRLPYVHLCIVGDGPATAELQQQAELLEVSDRIHWHGAVPYDTLLDVTSSADVGLCLIEPISKSYEFALPNKFFEYMMAGVPVLCTDLPALRQQMLKTPCGVLVDKALRETDIAEAVARLTNQATREALSVSEQTKREISYEQQSRHIADIVRELL